MTKHDHAIVWIDHLEAKVFYFDEMDVDRIMLQPHKPNRRIHCNTDSIGNVNTPLNQGFFERVEEAINKSEEILITGPASGKSDLAAHIKRHRPEIARCVVGIETIDHPSDGALIAVARICFKAGERLRPKI